MQLPFAPRGDHGNGQGTLEGVHPHKKIFLMDGGSDGPWVHTDGVQARTGILRGAAILHPAPVTNDGLPGGSDTLPQLSRNPTEPHFSLLVSKARGEDGGDHGRCWVLAGPGAW